MTDEQIFHFLFTAVFVLVFVISVYFRRKARQASGVIARSQEGGPLMLIRLVFASLIYVPVLVYMINPAWMAWSSVPLPAWLRWLGGGLGVCAVPLIYWLLSSLGSNISETVLVKESHALVTHGPYRWVRHPLYSVSLLMLIALSLLAANAFMAVMVMVGLGIILMVVIPKEETHLTERFGDAYRTYQQRTGRLLPRFRAAG